MLSVRASRFRCNPRNRLAWLKIIMVFLTPPTQVQVQSLMTGNDRFLPYPL
jgi:hypothetical protein